MMGSDNGTTQSCRSRITCSAARIGLMVALFVVFMVFVGISKHETGHSNLKSGQSTMHTPEDAEHYENYEWRELPHSVQKAAMRLGYNKNTWNDDAPYPPVFRKDWEELKSREQKAAMVLGYDEESWDSEEVLVVVKATVSPTEGETPEDTYESTRDDSESEPVAAVEPAAAVEPPAGNEGTEAPSDEDTPDDTPNWTPDSEDDEDEEEVQAAAPTGAPTDETTSEGTDKGSEETSAE